MPPRPEGFVSIDSISDEERSGEGLADEEQVGQGGVSSPQRPEIRFARRTVRGFLSAAKKVALNLLVDLPRALVALGGDVVVTVATAGNIKSRLAAAAIKMLQNVGRKTFLKTMKILARLCQMLVAMNMGPEFIILLFLEH